jgi:hypothetical protein
MYRLTSESNYKQKWVVPWLRQVVSQRAIIAEFRVQFPASLFLHCGWPNDTGTTYYFSDHASWIHYILMTNLMHWLLFIHKILLSSTCFEPQVLIFRRIQLYTCSIWHCHSLWEFLVACWYTAWVRTDYRGKVVGGCPIESDSTICCMCTTVSSWRWALEARNM